jgi:primosomal protein N' (replication factor Y)
VLGAAPAPVVRLRNLWRFHLQISGKSTELVRDLWQSVEKTLSLPEEVEFAIDVDPMNAR